MARHNLIHSPMTPTVPVLRRTTLAPKSSVTSFGTVYGTGVVAVVLWKISSKLEKHRIKGFPNCLVSATAGLLLRGFQATTSRSPNSSSHRNHTLHSRNVESQTLISHWECSRI